MHTTRTPRYPRSHSALLSTLLGTAAFTTLLTIAGPARADEHLVLVDTIDVGGKGLGAFDISFVDPKIDLYVLSDRTNASVDLSMPATIRSSAGSTASPASC
jgi:hypothetical protein